MPIYEYQCQACGYEFEKLQKISDAALQDCPQCEQATLKKKISAAGFRLSGGGWYETDFKSGDKKKNLAGEAKAEPKSDSSGEKTSATAKPESKPAAPAKAND